MKIAVRYMAQLREAAGTNSEEVELPGACCISSLLSRLADRHGDALRRLMLNPEGKPQSTLLVFIGDEHAPESGDLPIRDGSTVTLLSPIAGG